MAHRYRFVLVLALWGVRYGTPHVNGLVEAAFRLSPALDRVVLMTDRIRAGIDPRVKQSLFPPPYDRPEFYGHGYRAKLAVFSAIPASDDLPCVFLDLDSIIVGDLPVAPSAVGGQVIRLSDTLASASADADTIYRYDRAGLLGRLIAGQQRQSA